VAFYGSDAATLDAAATALEAAIPGLRVILRIAPAYGFDPTGAAAAADATRIAASGARLCFVALGAPKQERFATFARTIAPTCGFACIGAGLDFVVGRQTRAPAWMRALAMEWLWRMAGNPRRLAGRYLACALALPRLTADALRQRLVADQ
jgi:exopolysaccharide biosynthesis WecB/TagA/CpsF family protein